jgi:hypothetical protein
MQSMHMSQNSQGVMIAETPIQAIDDVIFT